MINIIQQIGFVFRFRYFKNCISFFKKIYYTAFGMSIGKGTSLPRIFITWPHQVSLGEYCTIEQGVYFKFDGIRLPGPNIIIGNKVFIGYGCEFNIRKSITIGNNTLIASGSKFIDHDHGIKIGELMRNQCGPEEGIIIGEDVWIGCNVIILKGVTVGSGAIVAAGAVVNKSIPCNEIWGGIPAKKIGLRK